MIVECHVCKARVDAEPLAHVEVDYDFFNRRTYLLKCPACQRPLVGECDDDGEGEDPWTQLVRVYPKPGRMIGFGVPDIVRDSLKEADKCLQIGAHLAAAAMAGRALEAVCRHYSTKDTYLGAGLKELKDKGVIDARLYQWGEELRDQRNIAAHAMDTTISAQDADDIVTFTYAIVDYVFLLTKKFEEFQKRKLEANGEKK